MLGGSLISAPDAAEFERLRHALAVAQQLIAAMRVAGEQQEAMIETLSPLRTLLEEAEREWHRLSAEAKALGDLLRPQGGDLFPPLVDAVTVQPGYEAALAATLGDDLQAPLDEASPHHWRDLGAFDATAPLPEGAQPLSNFVAAPAALAVTWPEKRSAMPQR